MTQKSIMSKSFPLANTTVAITGGNGFVGGPICRILTSLGADVRQFNIQSNSSSISETIGDINKKDEVSDFINSLKISERPLAYVLHLAGQANIPYSLKNPYETFQINAFGTLNLLEACRSVSSIRNVVLVSTYSVITHANTYTASKQCAEILGLSYFQSQGLPVSVCRLSNIYGPGQTQEAVIPSIIRQMLQSDVLSIGNLEAKRDFMYIEDAAEALVSIMLCSESKGQTVHAGTGEETSIGQIIETLGQITAFKGSIQVEGSRLRENDPNGNLPDTSFLLNHLGWKPKVDLFTGLNKTVAFLKAK